MFKLKSKFKEIFLKPLMTRLIVMTQPSFKFAKVIKPTKNLTIGKDSIVSYSANLDLTGLIMIGNNCMITSGVRIYTHIHYLLKKRDFSIKKEGKIVSENSIIIEDDVIIWDFAMIMPSVEIIHRGCMILSGAVLTKSTTGEYQVWGGNPAKLIKIKEE